jgi:hypothetical protein
MTLKTLKNKIKRLFREIEGAHRDRAAGMHEWEEKELRNVFALMVMGHATGMPSPPQHITMELLPEMEEDLTIMINRIQTSHDPLGELFSNFDPA